MENTQSQSTLGNSGHKLHDLPLWITLINVKSKDENETILSDKHNFAGQGGIFLATESSADF